MMDSSTSSCTQQSSEQSWQYYSCAADQREVSPEHGENSGDLQEGKPWEQRALEKLEDLRKAIGRAGSGGGGGESIWIWH